MIPSLPKLPEFHFWHWPDHTIGKAESRTLREEHNRVLNVLWRVRSLIDTRDELAELRGAGSDAFAIAINIKNKASYIATMQAQERRLVKELEGTT